jgi:predicted transcriptional regulator
MCKYCNPKDKSPVSILNYDNSDSVDTYYGQLCGVMVSSSLTMEGDKLSLNGFGSYRSRSDCYYEDNGLDIDNECSNESKQSYIQIKYCPFCGRKLESTVYEKTSLTDKREELHNRMTELSKKLDSEYVIFDVDWPQSRKLNEDGMPELTPAEIKKAAGRKKMRVSVRYGYEPEPGWRNIAYSIPILSSPNDKIRPSSYMCGWYQSNQYRLTDEMYQELADMKFFEPNPDKFNKMLEKRVRIQKKIEDVSSEIQEIDKRLSELG